MEFKEFIENPVTYSQRFEYLSLFSGAGLGDYGLKLAGGKCLGAVEIDSNRGLVHHQNHASLMWGNIRLDKDDIIEKFKSKSLDLIIAKPPCQSFSTANAKRGSREDPDHASRDARNHLFFEALHVIRGFKAQSCIIRKCSKFS